MQKFYSSQGKNLEIFWTGDQTKCWQTEQLVGLYYVPKNAGKNSCVIQT